MKPKTLTSERGVTLIELLVVIAVAGIILALAIPSYKLYIQSGRVTGAAAAIKRQLIAARTQAIANPQVHYGVYFDTTAGAPTTFIFQDRNSDGLYTTGDSLYLAKNPLPAGTKLQVGSMANNVIVFRGDGSAKNDGWNSGVITVSTTDGSKTKIVTVSKNTGKVSL